MMKFVLTLAILASLVAPVAISTPADAGGVNRCSYPFCF